jgi:micrococcal nuclease
VVEVVDGDTVYVSPAPDGEDSVRLIGVDVPEKAGSPRGEQPLGEETLAFARERLEGRPVELEFDVERRDDYDRNLAYLFVEGELFNETLLREGYAQVATFPPNTRYLDRFEEAQEAAREAGRGIWGLPEGEACRLTDRGNGIGGGCP